MLDGHERLRYAVAFYLSDEQTRLGRRAPAAPFAGAMAAYHRFQATADPAHRFHCWATIQAVSAGLDQLECGGRWP